MLNKKLLGRSRGRGRALDKATLIAQQAAQTAQNIALCAHEKSTRYLPLKSTRPRYNHYA